MVTPPNPSPKMAGALEDELNIQAELLEAMFDDPGVARLRRRSASHPAVARYDALLVLRNAMTEPETEHLLVGALAHGLMDRSTWGLDPTLRPFWEKTVPDESQRAQVIARIKRPDSFGDVILELYFWGRLRSAGFAAALRERTGEPDIELLHPAGAIWAEVKRIRSGTKPSRIRDAISKASGQIKKVSPARAGIVYIVVETELASAVFDDVLPADVQRYASEATRTLNSTDDKHAGQVIIAWDDMMVFGTSPNRSMYAVRRRAHVLAHANAISKPVFGDEQLALGQSIIAWVRYTPSDRTAPLDSIVEEDVEFSQQFRARNNWAGGMRETHARGVLKDPHGWQENPIGEIAVVLATRRIDLGRQPYVALLIGRRAEGQLMLTDGFRLTGGDDELDAMKVSPDLAFKELLRRFGLPVRFGGEQGLFIPLATAKLGSAIEVISDGAQFMINAFITLRETKMEAAWIFAINDGAYRRNH